MTEEQLKKAYEMFLEEMKKVSFAEILEKTNDIYFLLSYPTDDDDRIFFRVEVVKAKPKDFLYRKRDYV